MAREDWSDVVRELDAWEANDLKARIWVRDDDACHVTPALARLADLARENEIKIGLAVIPGKLGDDLTNYLNSGDAPFHPMCHGWMHQNHGGAGRLAEFGQERPLGEQLADLKRAHEVFSAAFVVAPVFVPPFNQIDVATAGKLPEIGFAALSSAPGVRLQRLARLNAKAPWLPALPVSKGFDVRRLDVQIDPVDWGRATARPERAIAETVCGELRLRRKGYVERSAPIGLLLHHLIHDDAIWSVAGEFLSVLRQHPAATFPKLSELMPRRSDAAHPAAA